MAMASEPLSTDPWDLPTFEPGTVWLVGAGPGDPGLLTMLAVQALRQADVILHDALIGDLILAGARPDAILDDVGKRAGRPSPRQPEIAERLIAHARAGRRVLRLKGGDPFVFGRGGEEALALAEAGIGFRVVPGVTAGVGGLAYAGIPATHRGMTGVVSLVTGRGSEGKLPESIDWQALALASPVIVFYMALGTIGTIARRLMAAGRPPMTPVAIISDATTDRQSAITTTLARASRDVVRLGAKSPAIIAVGEVVRLRETLAEWQQIGPDGGTISDTEQQAIVGRLARAIG
jgi:uroporphyrin-III C-methyltransferase